jgi:ubiquinone/menaquinone biosynthesis C-methylase UbiE
MGFHTYDVDRADQLDDPGRFEWCSAEELRSLLCLHGDAVVADLGSGTGFYTDAVAGHADVVYAVDVQPEMHELYAERGMPANVRPVTGEVADLPLVDDRLDAAFSTMTYHEYARPEALAELARVIRPGGRLVTVDWSRNGSRVTGPPLDERYDLGAAISAQMEAGFEIDRGSSRSETFVCRARR